jgi:hypothetical protein
MLIERVDQLERGIPQEGAPPRTPGPDAQGAWHEEDFSI